MKLSILLQDNWTELGTLTYEFDPDPGKFEIRGHLYIDDLRLIEVCIGIGAIDMPGPRVHCCPGGLVASRFVFKVEEDGVFFTANSHLISTDTFEEIKRDRQMRFSMSIM